MTTTLGVIMNPIHNINFKKDSTFGLLRAAQARGWKLAYMEPNNLYQEENRAYALIRSLTVFDNPNHQFELGEFKSLPLDTLSVILMRQDPPVDRAYLHTTQLLENAIRQGVPVINRPQSLRDYNEKLLALSFPQYCPPTLVTQSVTQAKAFLKEYQDIIVKPLDGMGGESIFRVGHLDPNQHVIFETFLHREGRYFLLQQYIPDIQYGDKRIIMIDGKPVLYGLNRIPKAMETRANLAVGGTGVASRLTERELEIAYAVGLFLKEKGLLWAGLDVIGNYLTEVNITSPTCVRELEAQCGLEINEQLLNCISETIV